MAEFSRILKSWYSQSERALPWKETDDPYKIWVSEIILQQTRVAQGTPYYLRFIKSFPDVYTLSEAKEEKVLKLWEGLGYYSRARNLHKGAKFIVNLHKGIFPVEYDKLIKIPGVGPYTAAAIASFAFNKPHPAIDGNVNRVLSRIYNIDKDLSKAIGKKEILALAEFELKEYNNPAEFNQAIMDFGATVCKPHPDCQLCPANQFCQAFDLKKVKNLPFKKAKKALKKRYFHYLIIESKGSLFIKKRIENDIWKGLFEFPMQESFSKTIPNEVNEKGGSYAEDVNWETQKLSHQHIFAAFHHVELSSVKKEEDWILVDKNDLNKYSFPKIIHQFFENRLG